MSSERKEKKKIEKKDLGLLISSVLGIVVIFVLLFNINNIFTTPDMDLDEIQQQQTEAIETAMDDSSGEKMGGITSEASTVFDSSEYQDCMEQLGEDPYQVVFYHSNSCPHCKAMKPIVQELEAQGYKFLWAESSDASSMQVISSCFREVLSGYVPEFICPSSGETHIGGMSSEELAAFADACN